MAWWGAPKDSTVSKKADRTFDETEEEEEEDEDEEEYDDEEPEEPPITCTFQIDWQDWDEEGETEKGDWWWKCVLAADNEYSIRCHKDKCPFWKGNGTK